MPRTCSSRRARGSCAQPHASLQCQATSSSSPMITNEQLLSLGKRRQSAIIRAIAPSPPYGWFRTSSLARVAERVNCGLDPEGISLRSDSSDVAPRQPQLAPALPLSMPGHSDAHCSTEAPMSREMRCLRVLRRYCPAFRGWVKRVRAGVARSTGRGQAAPRMVSSWGASRCPVIGEVALLGLRPDRSRWCANEFRAGTARKGSFSSRRVRPAVDSQAGLGRRAVVW